MHRVLAASVLALALVTFGCAGMQSKEVSKETKIKCPKCGYPFDVGEGMRTMETTR